uniref:Uncharacterized protein n=1 Tax=Arundo donax TaxID=35708 RepID=A0A0A9ENK9_ARUDO
MPVPVTTQTALPLTTVVPAKTMHSFPWMSVSSTSILWLVLLTEAVSPVREPCSTRRVELIS